MKTKLTLEVEHADDVDPAEVTAWLNSTLRYARAPLELLMRLGEPQVGSFEVVREVLVEVYLDPHDPDKVRRIDAPPHNIVRVFSGPTEIYNGGSFGQDWDPNKSLGDNSG